MAKYICKVVDYRDEECTRTMYIETEKRPSLVAMYLSTNIRKIIGNQIIPSMFEIPDMYYMDSCEMYSNEEYFRIRFSTCDGDEREITIADIDQEYINIDEEEK